MLKKVDLLRCFAIAVAMVIIFFGALFSFFLLNGNTKHNYREAHDIYLLEERLKVTGPIKEVGSDKNHFLIIGGDYCEGLQLPGGYCLGKVRKGQLYID